MVDHVVAIVEDNLAIRQSMELLLKLEGYEVSAHASPASFLADRTMRPACLITDQNMSGMTGSGRRLVSQLRQQENQIPVLLMCGYLSTDIIERASELGVSRVLETLPELDDLLEFVGGLLNPFSLMAVDKLVNSKMPSRPPCVATKQHERKRSAR